MNKRVVSSDRACIRLFWGAPGMQWLVQYLPKVIQGRTTSEPATGSQAPKAH